MKRRHVSRPARILVLLAMMMFTTLLAGLPSLSLRAAGEEVSLGPGEVQVARRGANSGNTLRWDWSASSTIAFSLSRVAEPQSVLYSTEGIHDASSLTIAVDDTYLLLWTNIGTQSITLEYSVSVDVGPGPILVVFTVVLLVIGIVVVLSILIARQDRKRRAERPGPPRVQSKYRRSDDLAAARFDALLLLFDARA